VIGYYRLGMIWADYDKDGWPDLLVANDSVTAGRAVFRMPARRSLLIKK